MKERNKGFDAIKGLACVTVVFMHCEFPGVFGTAVQCLARWSVPLFFAVSGYFFRKNTIVECLRKAKHIGLITICAVVLYIPVEIVLHLMAGDLSAYIQAEFTPFSIVSFVMLNSPVFVNGHLWFLFALIYTYLSMAVLIRLNLLKYRRFLCAALLCGHFLLAYGLFLLGKGLPAGAYRNFVFEGLPFFLLGNLFWQNQKNGKKTDACRASALVLSGLVLSLLERALLGRDFSVHLGSVVVLYGLLVLASNPGGFVWPRALSQLGEKYSLYVYIVHPAIYLLIDGMIARGGGSTAGIIRRVDSPHLYCDFVNYDFNGGLPLEI